MCQRRAQFFLHPYDRWYPLYQEYYASSLRRFLQGCGGRFERLSMTRLPVLLGIMRRGRYATCFQGSNRQWPWIPALVDRAARTLGGEPHSPGGAFRSCVGQYALTDLQGRKYRVCIDSYDFGNLPDRDLVTWSDVYFKTNYWPSRAYPDHVLPLANCSPLAVRQMGALRAARTTRKDIDVCCLVHVAGGRDGLEGVEHNLRLAEAVARLGGKTQVFAYLNCGDVEAQARRLARAGIRSSLRPMTASAYWSLTARSRLTVLRLGMHDCASWALTGALAIGACPVLDRAPRTRWPEPLLPGVHFLDLGIELLPDRHLGDAADYEAVPDRLAGWLRQEALARALAAETASYFDRHLHPVQLGAHLFGVLEVVGTPMDDGGSTTSRDRVNLSVEGRGDPSVAAT